MQTSPEPYSATQPEWNGPAAQPSCVLLDEEDGALHALASATRETAPNNSAHFGTMPRSPAVARGIDEEDFELVPDPFKPESPFWFKNGTDHTPIPLFADSVKQFSYGPPPTVGEPNPHRRICPIFRHFCNTSPSPNPAVDRFRCCLGH